VKKMPCLNDEPIIAQKGAADLSARSTIKRLRKTTSIEDLSL
jgi:hypothetical protein